MNVAGVLGRGSDLDEGAGQPADASTQDGASGDGLDLAAAMGWLFAVIGFGIGARVITDNSFLTHLATGRLILETGSVPTADPYSSLAVGESWTVQSWLPSLVYASLDASLGGWAIRLVNGVLGAAVTIGLWRLVAPARQLITRAGLVGLALLIGTYLWPPRPLLIGLLSIVLVLQVIVGQRSPKWLVPLFWVWVNSHGSFVLGCGLLGAVMVGAAIDERRVPMPELRNIAYGAAGCLLAMISPLGWRLLWFPIHMMSRREALDRVSEWASPSFRTPVEQLFLVLLVLIFVAARRGAPWRALVPAIVFFVGGLLAVRNLGLASLVIVALVAPALAGLGGTIEGGVRGLVPRAVVALATGAAVILTVGVLISGPVDVEDYPIEEISWLAERELIATDGVLVAQRDYVGNYLTLRFGAEARVFMDDRFDFYPLPVIEDHNGLLLGGDYDEIVERNDFDVVLWATETPLRRWLDDADEWEVVLDDDDWFVACRTTSPHFARCRP